MQSSKTRYQLVNEALQLSGRDAVIRTAVEGFLNSLLRQWALEYKYPFLKKIGDQITLAAGNQTAAVPTDLGAGMDNLLFGVEKLPMYEKSVDDFIARNGFRQAGSGSGRPDEYMLDLGGSLFYFNQIADQDYPFIPIYYRVPADLEPGNADYDNTQVWMPNDMLCIQALVWMIYQYTDDQREPMQKALVDDLKGRFQRGLTPVGGGSPKITLSRSVFKTRRW